MRQQPTLSDGEILLRTFHGRCGHRRQSSLPCATPGCKQGGDLFMYGYMRCIIPFGDEQHYVWKKLPLEAE